MLEPFRIALVEQPQDAELTVVGYAIRDYNILKAGQDDYKRLCAFLYAADQSVAGGLVGSTSWGWLYVSLLWVQEDLRGRGYGQRLLALAEDEARTRGVKHAYLDTFSFQAPEFYLRRGYRVFGLLEGFPAGHRRYFLTKEL